MAGSRERMKSEYMMKEESTPLLQRVHSARMLNQPVPPYQNYSRIHQPRHLHFQPDGSNLSIASNFDDGIATYLPLRYQPNYLRISGERSSSGDKNGGCNTTTNLQFKRSSQKRHGAPPRAPRRYSSHHPNQRFNHSTAPRRPIDRKAADSVRSVTPSSGRFHGQPMLERKKSGYKKRNNHPRNVKSDRSGVLLRNDDRTDYPKQQLRRSSSLSIISQETRDFSSSKSLLTNKTSTKPPQKSNRTSRTDSNKSRQFQPQRSTSIHRKFDKKIAPEQDDDIWIERIVLNGPTGRKKTYFKSLRGNVVRNEPPTGARTIIYLEDIIVDRQASKKPPKTKPPLQRQPQPQPQPRQLQSQQTEIIPSSLPKEETNQEPVETMVDNGEKLQKVKLKRRASFFGFMKKNRKNKTDGDCTDTK
jgi:hypothetical protein